MKKLIKLIEDVGPVKTSDYPNIKWEGSAASDEINSSLLEDIDNAADAVGITVTIGTANSGHRDTTSSGNPSRHKTGEAIDINRINGKGWGSVADAKKNGIYDSITAFVNKLSNGYGYTINRESGNDKSVLYFGFSDGKHENHIHVSNNVGSSSSSNDSSSSGDEEDSAEGAKKFGQNFMIDMISKVAKPMFGLNESKQKRIINDIDRIKQLLK
jgi:hypothetical protein